MKLNRKSKLIRWAYRDFPPFTWVDWDDYIPDQTSICPLFWRTVLLTPFMCVGFLGLSIFAVLYLSVVMPFILAFEGIKWCWSKVNRRESTIDEPSKINLITEYIKAKKSKVCPMVEIVREY